MRVLGANMKGRGTAFYAGIEWALQQGIHVVNMSLSSKSDQWFAALHEIADDAYFKNTMLVCAANDMPGPTYPSPFASVFSVAARPTDDPEALAYNPSPPGGVRRARPRRRGRLVRRLPRSSSSGNSLRDPPRGRADRSDPWEAPAP